MQKQWLLSAAAVLALMALPAAAEEKPKPATPAAPVLLAQAGGISGTAAAPAEEKPTPRFTYGGSADFFFSTNFNDPFTGTNLFRAFDVKDERGVHLGLIDLWAQYARDPIGFRVDINFGPTAKFVNAFEPSRSDVWDNIQQVLISGNLDKAGRTYVEFGKFVTPIGLEVIEPKDNWLYTRGMLFNLAIPFYHLGGRVFHYFNDADYVAFTGHRGWNAVGDPGHGPGFILTGSKAISPKLTLTGNLSLGDEPGLSGNDFRTLFDFIALYNPGGRWEYALNLDTAGQDGANWHGLSAMARYSINSRQAVTLRGEVLRDNGGLVTGSSQTLGSVTLGYGYTFNKYAQARLEYRHDFSNRGVYPKDRVGRFGTGQDTLVIAAILSY